MGYPQKLYLRKKRKKREIQQKMFLSKEDIVGEIEETVEKEQQDAQDVQESSASPPHANKLSQQDSIIIKDVLDNTYENVNPLTDDDLNKLKQDSTNAMLKFD